MLLPNTYNLWLRCTLAMMFCANIPCTGWAAIESPFIRYSADTRSKHLDLSYIETLTRTIQLETPVEIGKFIPLSLQPSSSEEFVTEQILSHCIQSAFESIEIQDSRIKSAARSISGPVNADFSLGTTGASDSRTQHKMAVKVEAARSIASITYNGYVDAQAKFYLASNLALYEVSKAIGRDTRIVFNHIEQAQDRIDRLSLSFAW